MQSSNTPACPGWLMTAVAPWGENAEDAFDQGLVELGLGDVRLIQAQGAMLPLDLRPHRLDLWPWARWWSATSPRLMHGTDRRLQPASHGRLVSHPKAMNVPSSQRLPPTSTTRKRFCCCEESSSVGWQVETWKWFSLMLLSTRLRQGRTITEWPLQRSFCRSHSRLVHEPERGPFEVD